MTPAVVICCKLEHAFIAAVGWGTQFQELGLLLIA